MKWFFVLVLFILMTCLIVVIRSKKSDYAINTLTNDGSVQAGIAVCNTLTNQNAINACYVNVTAQYMVTQCPYLSGKTVSSSDPQNIQTAWQNFQASNTTIYDSYISISGSGLGILASVNQTVSAGPTITDLGNCGYLPGRQGISLNPNVGPAIPIFVPSTTPAIQVGQTFQGNQIPGGPNVLARVVYVTGYQKPSMVYVESTDPNSFTGEGNFVTPGPPNAAQTVLILYPPGTPNFSPTGTATLGFGTFTTPLIFGAGTFDSGQPELTNVMAAYTTDVAPAFLKFITNACPQHFINLDGQGGNEGCMYNLWTTDQNSTSIFRWSSAQVTLQRFMKWSKDTSIFSALYGPGTVLPSTTSPLPASVLPGNLTCSGTVLSNGLKVPPTNWLQ